jgi:hypothetical protein
MVDLSSHGELLNNKVARNDAEPVDLGYTWHKNDPKCHEMVPLSISEAEVTDTASR